jgi:hypothetical protein
MRSLYLKVCVYDARRAGDTIAGFMFEQVRAPPISQQTNGVLYSLLACDGVAGWARWPHRGHSMM